MSNDGAIELEPRATVEPSTLVQVGLSEAVPATLILEQHANDTLENQTHPEISKGRTVIVITAVTSVTGIGTFLSGLLTVGIPRMAIDIGLNSSLLLWPASINALTMGCTLLLLGSVADVVGSRRMYLIGTLLQSLSTLACGLSRTGTQLLIFRAFAGLSSSFTLPASVSIITSTFDEGRRRNLAFSCMGGGQPLGFSLGLALGGVFVDTVGWRWGFYIFSIFNTVVFGLAIWGLPKSIDDEATMSLERLKNDIDWTGGLLASASVALMSYVFASITGSTSQVKDPSIIALLSISVALIPAFIFWVGRQEKLGRPALIPNSLWRNRAFSSICIDVFLAWGTFNALESLIAFYFQYVQHIDALGASLRMLPGPAAGLITNLAIGVFVHRIPTDIAVLVGCALASVAPLLAALMNTKQSYWRSAFPPVMMNPVGADVLFTIANLIITGAFPKKTQALAGSVYNTVAQIGKSVGLATAAIIASSVTQQAKVENKGSPEALLVGYRASWWYCFGATLVTVFVSLWGLRSVGKIGVKRD